MSAIKLCFSPALLLLLAALSCSLWGVGRSVPVRVGAQLGDSCASHAYTLLRNITAALEQEDLFRPIDCSKQNLKMNTESSTPSACAPKELTCSGHSKLKFDQDSCVAEIGRDLSFYYNLLAARLVRHDVSTVLSSLREFMTNCWSLPTDAPTEAVAVRVPTYEERLDLCKVLKGFQVRTITINRAMGYMNSGEHMK